jgi:hypothetical protein
MATHPRKAMGKRKIVDGVESSRMLEDMRFIYRTRERPGGKETSEGRRKCREFYNEDKKAFLAKLTALETAYEGRKAKEQEVKAAAVAAGLGVKAEVDEGTERVREMIGKVLAECKKASEGEK